MGRYFSLALLLTTTFWNLACTPQNDTEENPDLIPQVIRFEQELAQASKNGPQQVMNLRTKHPLFYKLLVEEMMGMGQADSALTAEYLCRFQRDRYTDSLTRDISGAFPAGQDPLLYKTLPHAVARFRKEFNTGKPTQITTFLSGFRYQAALDDSGELLIGLDTYMGQNYRYYATAPYIYDYQTRRMSRDYLLADALRLLLQDQIEPPQSTASLLEHMIASGKIHYAIKKLVPDVPDSALFRYTALQASWANQYEKEIWQYLMSQNLVYSSEIRSISRFMDDGPATLELDPNAPPRLGEWTGYSIVTSYMEKYPKISLQDLFTKSGSEIFRNSGYRGQR